MITAPTAVLFQLLFRDFPEVKHIAEIVYYYYKPGFSFSLEIFLFVDDVEVKIRHLKVSASL